MVECERGKGVWFEQAETAVSRADEVGAEPGEWVGARIELCALCGG